MGYSTFWQKIKNLELQQFLSDVGKINSWEVYLKKREEGKNQQALLFQPKRKVLVGGCELGKRIIFWTQKLKESNLNYYDHLPL